ncbi:MAG: DoxX family protein [Flammeovirgaceae bacterium]
MKYLKSILFWIIGITFITIGVLKYLNLDSMSESIFNRAHYPRWFFYAVATVEFLAGSLLLITASATKKLGSLLIALIMLGALGTRILLNQPFRNLIIPGIIFLIAILMSFKLSNHKK